MSEKEEKTLEQILKFAGMSVNQLLKLIPDNELWSVQAKNLTDAHERRRQKLRKQEVALSRAENNVELSTLRLRVDEKRLRLENKELDIKLEGEAKIALRNVEETIDMVEDTLLPDSINSGNEQMIDAYIKKGVDEIRRGMGLQLKHEIKKEGQDTK